MKMLKPAAFAAALALGALNTSAQSGTATDPAEQLAAKKTQKIQEKVTGVTQEQLTKIRAVEQSWAKARQDAKNSGIADAADKSKLKSLRESRDAKIKGILTADQYTQYQSMEKWEHTGYKPEGDNN